jgi:sporulation protein YlmC with PRC-barrel domain
LDLTSDDILGKEAVDPEGEILGVVMKLHLDREKNTILGITVDQGMWKPDLFIGIDFIEKFGVDAIFLNKIPISKYIGIRVYTHDGISIGKVSEVNLNEEKIQSFSISISDEDSRSPFRKKQFIVSKNEISEIGYAIILKKSFRFPNAEK